MKPNFALSLSFDGLRLMHRVQDGWHLVGEVSLDSSDLTGSLAALRRAAQSLEPGEMRCKLLIPNDQIKYLALDTTRAEDDDVRAALTGATPYAVDELSYDFVKGGGRTYIAAVAKETLSEAQDFAQEHDFNPVCFAAVPEPFTYVGEAFFGAVGDHAAMRDAEPVVVTGTAPVVVDPDPAQSVDTDPVFSPDPQPEPLLEPSPAEEEPTGPSYDAEAQPDADEGAEATQDTSDEDVADGDGADGDGADEAGTEDAATEIDKSEEDGHNTAHTGDTDDRHDESPQDPSPEEAAAPVFASRLRADRNEGRPAPPPEPDTQERRRAPPALAVPTGRGSDPMPPVSAPSRDAEIAAPASTPLVAETPEPEVAPAITGEAPTALPPEAASAAASLSADTAPEDATANQPPKAKAATVGGMFASRRMARSESRAKSNADGSDASSGDKASRRTVFGARTKPNQKAAVGGKPRFLGLILTAILLVFMLAIAAFAALSEDGFARWFRGEPEQTQIATAPEPAPTPEVAPEPAPEPAPAAQEVAAQPPSEVEPLVADDALAAPTAPSGGQVLTPQEAQRIYAATGVWQKAPRIPVTPRTTTLDALDLSVTPRAVARSSASPLVDANSVAGDAVIATPVDPPPPSATFDFGDDGLVVATPEGAVTPDGTLVIVGRPALNPPARPGTIAPEITPQDQLAAVIPEAAEPVVDAPEDVIIIAGRPTIAPPVRPGTNAPAPAPQALVPDANTLLARDGLLVLAGTPPILPPVRSGIAAPTAEPQVVPDPAPEPTTEQALAAPALPEGLNVIAGSPPILPPVRPGTRAPQRPEQDLSSDVAAALATSTAQTPTEDTPRPLARPQSVVQAAAAAAPPLPDTPAFRPRLRPAGLAPERTTPDETAPAPQTGLQLAPEIAAAVQAAASRPDAIIDATAQAVATSTRPDPRPRNMVRIVSRAQTAQATQVAAPRTVAPSGPTGSAVAQNATLENAINLRDINLIGIYGSSGDRRALVRLANGRYVRVTVGDSLDGGRVTAITATALSYTKRGRAITLEVAS